MKRTDAILLIGPTGSGKTPFGQLLQQRGLRGRPCSHFDFGEQLRRAASAEPPPPGLNSDDVEFIGFVLRSGALLEDEHFRIAKIILRAFISKHIATDDGLVVLNGLPRHVGQANDIDAIVAVQAAVHLSCTAEVVFERIRTNAGADRTGRVDDEHSAIENKLEIFTRRIAPLIGHYRSRDVRIKIIQVNAATTAQQMWDCLNSPL